MPRERFRSLHSLPIEAVFLIGGEDRSPVYPQPGLRNDKRWGLYAPYDTGAAAIEKMADEGYPFTPIDLVPLLTARDGLRDEIKNRVINASEIEKDRQKLADTLNGLIIDPSVDPKG